MYLFESSTPELSQDIVSIMTRHQMLDPAAAAHALEHIEVDHAHAKLFRDLITGASADPAHRESIVVGFDAFAAVYPAAIFDSALACSVQAGDLSGQHRQ